MKDTFKVLWMLSIIIFNFLLKSCDFEQKINHVSKNEQQSKQNNLYVNNISLVKLQFQSESAYEPLSFLRFTGWLEKASTYRGEKLIEIDDKSFSVILDLVLDEKLELNKENYNKTWSIYYNRSNSVESITSSVKTSIKVNFKVDKDSIYKPIELKIVKFNSSFHPNDRKDIGSLVIKAE